MTNEKSKIKFLDCLSFQEFPTLEKVNKCYPGVPVIATLKGWVLFRSLEDFYTWFNGQHTDYQL